MLDVAASVVNLLKRFFPEHIDSLEPEQAFLEVGAGGLRHSSKQPWRPRGQGAGAEGCPAQPQSVASWRGVACALAGVRAGAPGGARRGALRGRAAAAVPLLLSATTWLLPQAPHLPLLLPAATPGNVAMLLSGGDEGEAWKVRCCCGIVRGQ